MSDLATHHAKRRSGLLILLAACCMSAQAAGSRQLGTGGGTQLEGSAGGGIVPWAVIGGYAAREERGATAFLSRVAVDDFDLGVIGVSAGFNNRVEVSLARQRLDIGRLLPGRNLEQDIVGLKVRLFGEVLYTAAPQISLGAQFKHNRDFDLVSTLGARDDSGVDLYLSVAKVWLAGAGGYNAFGNLTLRRTEANQTGLLGFGGDRDDGHKVVVEASLGLFLDRRWAVGIEYRDKPDQLDFAGEEAWSDLFVAWFPNRRWSLVGAYVDLGDIAGQKDQRGLYLSLERAF